MTRSRSRLLALSALLAAAATLPSCDGLDTGTDNLPDPAIFQAADADACGSAGSTSITLGVVGTRVVEGFPQTSQTGPDRVEVPGTVASLAAGDSVYGLLIDDATSCPIATAVEVTPAADGSFVLTLALGGRVEFRVVAVTGPAGSTPACADATDCIQLDAAGTVVSVTGMSNSVGIRLP